MNADNARDEIRQLVDSHGGEPPLTAATELYAKLSAKGVINPAKVSAMGFLRRIKRLANGGEGKLEALHQARTNRERSALLNRYRQELPLAEYDRLVKNARNEGAITPRTLLELGQQSPGSGSV